VVTDVDLQLQLRRGCAQPAAAPEAAGGAAGGTRGDEFFRFQDVIRLFFLMIAGGKMLPPDKPVAALQTGLEVSASFVSILWYSIC